MGFTTFFYIRRAPDTVSLSCQMRLQTGKSKACDYFPSKSCSEGYFERGRDRPIQKKKSCQQEKGLRAVAHERKDSWAIFGFTKEQADWAGDTRVRKRRRTNTSKAPAPSARDSIQNGNRALKSRKAQTQRITCKVGVLAAKQKKKIRI